ncbi:hypothetical protein H8D04_00770 [bacterium]|nr:hypothetical protein [bacterium]
MALKDLLTDLSNFKYTDYDNAGTNNSQIEGRHGSTVHPDDHSIKDDKVGFGVYPNDTPQSFDVRGYTITGDKILFTGAGNNSDVSFFNTQSHFVSNDDYLMKTDMLDTKKFPARDNNVIGFDQPFILKDIGDRWGPGGLGAIDAGIVRGGLVTSITRTAADVIRLGKFAITPRGIMFGLKQAGLQLLNPRGDTRIWNPLSLGSIAPTIHIDRHLGGKTYETSPFGPAGFTILGAYAGAIETGKGWTLIQKGMRTTIAHQLGMVPTAGGKPGSFPAIPEIKFDDDDGTIESLSKNILSITKGKFPHPGTNHYELNGEYAISHGTPIIPQTVPEAGSWIIKDKIDASKEMGESISKFDHERTTGDNVTYTSTIPSHEKIHDGTNIYKDKNIYLPASGKIEWTDKQQEDSSKNLDLIDKYSIPTIEKAPFGTTIKGESGERSYWVNDEYSPGKPYSKTTGEDNSTSIQISSQETLGNDLLKKTRLQIDENGDPIVLIKTAHPNSSDRFKVEGGETLKNSIKLQNFPLLNEQSSGNLGSEGQSLGFVDESKKPISLSGNLYGPDDKISTKTGADYKRKGFGEKSYQESIKGPVNSEGGYTDRIVDKGRFSVNDNNMPQAVKRLSTLNSDTDTLTLGDNKVVSQIVQGIQDRTLESNKTGNILDRYKTLAYGDIPTKDITSERYDTKKVKNDKAGQYPGQAKYEAVPPEKQYKIPEGDDLGLVKKTITDEKYNYGHGTGIGEPDFVNMIKYGEGDENFYPDDYIKFKFFDIVNSKNIIFRAFLSGISEALSPEWSSERYIGRPDSVHVYQGVERSMSFEFMVVPSSKQELPILWEKMNYLVGLTYPTWKSIGPSNRMEAPFINLTIGDMYNSVPGFLSSLSITVEDQATWEIEDGFQLPKALNVSCEFTHIGQHTLASQGKHYDLGWLKPYNGNKNPQLETRDQLTGLFSE